MKIDHTIVFTRNERVYQRLCALEFPVDKWFQLVKISEDDPRWNAVQALRHEFQNTETCCITTFTPNECRQADWVTVNPSWHWEYPKPDDDFGYLQVTYDLTHYCENCGIGQRQKAPFHVKSEPKWGMRNMLQLNWVFDEYFVRPEIWETVFKPFGIGAYPVLHHRSGQELKTVVQLKIDCELTVPLQLEGYSYEVCLECNRRKYLPISCGRFPAMTGVTADLTAVKSREYFGSGHSGFHEVFFSNALYRNCIEHKVKGVSYKPVGDQK